MPTTTVSAIKDEMKQWTSEILDPQSSLTSLQREASQKALEKRFARRGVAFFHSRDEDASPTHDNSSVLFNFTHPLLIDGTAVVTDVHRDSIQLSAEEQVAIELSPGPFTRLHNLSKGQSVSFTARTRWARYYFKAGIGDRRALFGGDEVLSGFTGLLAKLFRSP